MKVLIDGRHLEVKVRANNWDLAGEVALRNKRLPPDGYKLISTMTRNRDRSGSRCELSMRFLLSDKRVDAITEEEAFSEFQIDADVASGRATYRASAAT